MDIQRKVQFCICCLCGIPGSGKSTICEQLSLQLQGNYLIFIIDYDKILLDSSSNTAQLWASLCSEQRENEETMKSARAQVLRTVEFLMQQIMTNEKNNLSILTKPTYINEDIWRNVMDLCWEKLCSHDFMKCPQVLFLLDDNMYFRSMRYECCKIAKLYGAGFCEIFVSSSVEKAKERNKCRHGRDFIDDNVIEKISQKLEAPDSSKHSWENFNSVLNADGYMTLMDVKQMVKEAFMNPAHHTLQVNTEEKLNSQNICSASLIHQVDLILRKCISKTMIKGKENSTDLKQLNKQVSFVKENILCLMKKGELCMPESLNLTDVKDSSKDENSELYMYIQNLFECNVKSCQNE